MNQITILRKGGIYFFYRPKVKNREEVQRFSLVLSSKRGKYDLLTIGKKHLPTEVKDKYFLFVEAANKSKPELLESLKERHHRTGKGETTDPASHCLAEGKFIIAKHENHTHFIYQLSKPSRLKEIQAEFSLKEEGDYLISVKNPRRPSPSGTGLDKERKAHYPEELQTKLDNYSFIPLEPASFLDHEGAELILISKQKPDLAKREEKLQECLTEIKFLDLANEFEKITSPETVAPLK